MRWIGALAVGLSLAAALSVASPVEAQVRVRYAPEFGFTDVSDASGSGRSVPGTLTELTRTLQALGQWYLPAGERLDVTVLDFNVAGFNRPFGYPRVVTSATPPQIKLAYTLYCGRTLIAQNVDNVTDLNFLYTENPKFSSGPLYYEKRILRDWFEERFKYRQGLRQVALR